MVLDPARMEPEELEGRRDQDSKNRSIATNPIWSNQEQDESFLFIYIHCLLYLLFSKVIISINLRISPQILLSFWLAYQ